jgi:hypothetical protein
MHDGNRGKIKQDDCAAGAYWRGGTARRGAQDARGFGTLAQGVGDALQRVEVKGNAVYGPVGIYPLQLHILEATQPVEPNLDHLRQAVHSMEIVPNGMSIVEYVDQLRQADAASA